MEPMLNTERWNHYLHKLETASFFRKSGKVTSVSPLGLEAVGLEAAAGDLCEIPGSEQASAMLAQVVKMTEACAYLMPLGDTAGIGIGCEVYPLGKSLKIKVSDEMLGNVVDSLGHSLGGRGGYRQCEEVQVKAPAINPLGRQKIDRPFLTGVRAIDAFIPVGKGQRIGIFAGSGVGKSTLLGMIAKNAEADVNVICLIGERGREVNEFVDHTLGEDGIKKSIVVVATADQPTLLREMAAYTATAIAEYFSQKGKDVLLIMDSVTRFAMARRELGLSIGEPATSRGYTPSTFTELPKLIERAGNFKDRGSITAIYTVLVEGDDMNEPVADSLRAVLDGHIVLNRELANKNHYPAIDVLKSISRLASDLWNAEEKKVVSGLLKVLSLVERYKDIVDLGVYRPGSNAELDRALAIMPALETFLTQHQGERVAKEALFQHLIKILHEGAA
jgi:flagellum-specific ATP synthase